MRPTCQVCLPSGACGKPAVDYTLGCYEEDGKVVEDRFYMCAEHWNEIYDTPKPDDDVDFSDFD